MHSAPRTPHSAPCTPHLHYGDLTDGSNISRLVEKLDPAYFRPTEVYELLGDPGRAKALFG